MHKLQNITDEAYQRHTLLLDDEEAIVELRFLPAVETWLIDVNYKDKKRFGSKLTANSYHLRSYNFPFDFTVLITDDSGLDPFRADDFVTGRCELYFITPEEMRQIRRQEQ